MAVKKKIPPVLKTISFWLGDEVCIKDPRINGVVVAITHEGACEEVITIYRVRYWMNGEVKEVNIGGDELIHIEPNKQRPVIGFAKV